MTWRQQGSAALLLLILMPGCSGTARMHDRWKPADNAAPTPTPVAEPTPEAEPIPETLRDVPDTPSASLHPGQAYAEAEAAIQTHIIALALQAAHVVVAAQRAEVGALGPELLWYPTLSQVAARQRQVTYAAPRAGHVLRGNEAEQPFLVEIIIPCIVHTTSGDGIAYAGDAPLSPIGPDDRVLPQATRATDVTLIAEGLRPAAMAALAALAGLEPKTETVQVTLLFAYRRMHDDVVLLRHAQADPQP